MIPKRTLLLVLVTWLAVLLPSGRAAVPAFLPAEDIFTLEASVDERQLIVRWHIADGHYAYVSRLSVRSTTPGVILGQMVAPAGEVKHDRWFGEMEVLRGDIALSVPVVAGQGTVSVAATVQGCADAGLCYPPLTRTVEVELPPAEAAGWSLDFMASVLGIRSAQAAGSAAASTAADDPDRDARVNSLRSALGLGAPAPAPDAPSTTPPTPSTPDAEAEAGSSALGALSDLGRSLGLGGGEDEFLDPDEAFQLREAVNADGTVVLTWEIAPGYYLYRHQFRFDVAGGEGAALAAAYMAPGKAKTDPYFGDVEVYYKEAVARVGTLRGSDDGQNLDMQVTWQGCADAGLCYPPAKRVIPVVLPASFTPGEGGTAMVRLTRVSGPSAATTGATAALSGQGSSAPVASGSVPGSTGSPGTGQPMVSEQDRLTRLLMSDSVGLAMLAFFVGGLLLAFTPCVLPMIPILSSIIAGEGENVSRRRSFTLSLVYVQGMALTYTAIGIIAGESGTNLQVLMQQPWVLVTFAMVFVALAMSMFGFYELQIPAALQARLVSASNAQRSGSLAGAGVMGALSALIVGPCVAPPLVGALGYIALTGDSALGGLALYALAMGMGVPLLAVGLFGGEVLPRAGAWMNRVKVAFGVIMLAVAVWFLERVLPGWATMGLWAVLFIVTAIYMGALDQMRSDADGWHRLSKGIGLVTLVWGVMMLVGAGAGSTNPLAPLGNLGTANSAAHTPIEFRQVKGIEGLRVALREAAARAQPVMLDYYADWCITCKEMEETTFTDAGVKDALRGVMVLQTDVTAVDQEDTALMKHFQVAGPPTIQFFRPDGEELRGYRIVGPMEAGAFLTHVQSALGS